MTANAPADPGKLQMLSTSQLLLDWHNPRLRAEDQLGEDQSPDDTKHQRALALLMAKEYHPYRIAESIARHQYFLSEPMIAVRHRAKYRVIEGNRRLTAILGLQQSDLRAKFAKESSGWRSLPDLPVDQKFPVLVVRDERTIAPLLGYRHIAGIEPWAAYAQARYIAGLVAEGKTLTEVAELVGKTQSAVRAMYRDHDILEQGSKKFGLDTSPARKKFGVFNAAMSSRGIREHLGGPAPRHVNPEEWPLPDDHGDRLAEVLLWIFGSEEQPPVITDSRQLSTLSKVLGDNSMRGVDALRRGQTLEQAWAAIKDPNEQFALAIESAVQNMESTRPAIGVKLPPPTRAQLTRLGELVSELLSQASPEDVDE